LVLAAFKYKLPGVICCLIALLGLGIFFVAMERSTYPSSARRITVVGHAVDWQPHRARRSQWWTFVLMPSPDQRILLRTGIDLPENSPAHVSLDSADTVRVTYLDEKPVLSDDPRAVRIEVLTGASAGWTGSEDANWFGWWIGVPGGLLIAIVSFGMAQTWRRAAKHDTKD
jgi:hypothetical protein